jgi:hypothetical protein
MSKQRTFIKHLQTLITTDETLSATFNDKNIYRRSLPQVVNPTYPCATIYYDRDLRQAFSEIDRLQVYIEIHTKEFFNVEDIVDRINELLHLYRYANDTIVVYNCFSMGGLVTPAYDAKLNVWSSVLQFEVHLG